MRWAEFLAGYDRGASSAVPPPDLAPDLFARGREHASRWCEILYDFLDHGERMPTDAFNSWAVEYSAWTSELDRLLLENQEAVSERLLQDPVFGNAYTSELAFHRLNAQGQWSWVQLAEHTVPAWFLGKAILKSRYDMAVKALDAQRARERAVGNDVYFDRGSGELRGWSTGALTEIDSYVTLLELTARNPQMVVVPGPPQFEQLAGARNADFVVIDIEGCRVRGVQVKTTLRPEHRSHYDSTRITLVDGVTDLHNTRAVRTDPRHSDKKVVPWPGLVSAHFVRELPMDALDGFVERKELIQKKLAARRHTGTIASRNALAFTAVNERILYDMVQAARAKSH